VNIKQQENNKIYRFAELINVINVDVIMGEHLYKRRRKICYGRVHVKGALRDIFLLKTFCPNKKKIHFQQGCRFHPMRRENPQRSGSVSV